MTRKIWHSEKSTILSGSVTIGRDCRHEDLRKLVHFLSVEADKMETAHAKSMNEAVLRHGYVERGDR